MVQGNLPFLVLHHHQYTLKHSTVIDPVTLKLIIKIFDLLLPPCLAVTVLKKNN